MGYPLAMTFPVLWGDMDALGHVNNVRYFRWYESARIALFEKLAWMPAGGAAERASAGGEQAALERGAAERPAAPRRSERAEPQRVGPILATTTCDFLEPVTYPGEVVVGVRVTRIGTTSVTMEYGLWRAEQPERLVARGSSVIVLVEYASGRKLAIPPEIRERLAPFQVESPGAVRPA